MPQTTGFIILSWHLTLAAGHISWLSFRSVVWFKTWQKWTSSLQLLNIFNLWETMMCIVSYCLDATDLKISQLIWPAARGRCNDKMIRLGVWHILYSFRDVHGLYLSQHGTQSTRHALDLRISCDWLVAELMLMKVNFENFWAAPMDVWMCGWMDRSIGS